MRIDREVEEKYLNALKNNPDFKVKGGKFYAFMKRTIDIVASLLAILLLSWLFIILAILVKVTSKGPIIYKSIRYAEKGKYFNMYKFRSMYKDADEGKAALMAQNEVEGGVTFKMKNDPRITPLGKFLRKTSLDELPQLFNILFGNMSICGPRAGLKNEIMKYDDRAILRLSVKQGLTGEWQTHGRSTTTFETMIDMDLAYITKKRGFWYDIKLMFLTVWCIITGNGAE